MEFRVNFFQNLSKSSRAREKGTVIRILQFVDSIWTIIGYHLPLQFLTYSLILFGLAGLCNICYVEAKVNYLFVQRRGTFQKALR